MRDGADVLRLGLARRDYLRHPLLLAELLGLRAASLLVSGPARRAVDRASEELKVEVCHRRAVARCAALARAARGPLRLNLGCGDHHRAGWINVDLDLAADARLDLRRPLPLPDASCAEIYAEHVVEHLAYPGEVDAVLRDWWRVLAPGGRVSVGVPDTEEALRAYVERRDDYFDRCRREPWYPPWNETRLDQINFHFRQQGLGFGHDHLYAYDADTLAARLRAAGFVDIAARSPDPARDTRLTGSLSVDAIRPRIPVQGIRTDG